MVNSNRAMKHRKKCKTACFAIFYLLSLFTFYRKNSRENFILQKNPNKESCVEFKYQLSMRKMSILEKNYTQIFVQNIS